MFSKLFNFFGGKSVEAQSSEPLTPSGIYNYDPEVIKSRSTLHQIHPILHARQSLRAMDGNPVDNGALMSLFEAARWTPSHFNCQNWRFIYTTRQSPYWNQYLDALWDRNRAWAKEAGVLVVAMSKKSTKDLRTGQVVPLASHSFEAGSAWMAMALEGTARGLVIHAMGGYDQEKIAKTIGLKSTDEYQIEAMIAIGNHKPGPEPEKVTQRVGIDKFICEDTFTEKL